jgi:phage repressor protein C with HTH and peptisase S24 domain
VVHAGVGSAKSVGPTNFVAIPLLPVRAATQRGKGENFTDLDQLRPEAMWAAPAEWCPNPALTISFRVVGNSMSPLILEGYIIAVDTSPVSRDDLVGKIVVAWNAAERQLLVTRLIRFDHQDALISDQRDYQCVSLSPGSHWRIIGGVFWWAGKAE